MSTKRSIRRFAALALLMGMSIGYTQSAQAQISTDSYMVAKMSGKFGAEGFAVYLQSKVVGVFGVEIDGWDPGAQLLVTVKRGKAPQLLTWVKTDANGHGAAKISSRYTPFPQLINGDLIQVWDGRTQILSGRLQIQK